MTLTPEERTAACVALAETREFYLANKDFNTQLADIIHDITTTLEETLGIDPKKLLWEALGLALGGF